MKKIIYILAAIPTVFLSASCNKEEKLKFPEGVFTFTPKTGQVPADGSSFYVIEVGVKSDYRDAIKSVTLKTDKGSLESETISFNNDGTSLIRVNSSDTGTANITLSFNEQQFVTAASFIKAYPESIVITADASATTTINSRIDLAILLKRSVGNVSRNTHVQMSATDDAGNPKGQFFNTSGSDASGNISSQYWLQDSLYHGFIHFKAVYISATDTVTGMNQVYFTE